MVRFRAILWDVYGTLLQARAGDLEALVARGDELQATFGRVVVHFAIEDALCRLAPDRRPEASLGAMYLQRIREVQERKRSQGVAHPEVRIEEIWLWILEQLAENGLRNEAMRIAPTAFAREVALYFERAANPKRLYPGAWEALRELKQHGARQGIVSNAQFYTRIELGELLRIESDGCIGSLHSVFDETLVFLSCDFGYSKPDPALFLHACHVLDAEGIAANECLYVGNDIRNDVWGAQQAGFATALFAGDPESVRWRKDDPVCAGVQPDTVIENHQELLKVVGVR